MRAIMVPKGDEIYLLRFAPRQTVEACEVALRWAENAELSFDGEDATRAMNAVLDSARVDHEERVR